MRTVLLKIVLIIMISVTMTNCSDSKSKVTVSEFQDIQIVGAMKNVMWKGKLEGSIILDTISPKEGLYGIGPESFLTGELLISNGQRYTSRVVSDSTMTVGKNAKATAPFFVYAHVNEWNRIAVPETVTSLQELNEFIDAQTQHYKRPFAFKLKGIAKEAAIHIQNLPKGAKVSSPKEAHQGQVNYTLQNEEVEIIGFFSTEHKGVFTHHDSNTHMHLITTDETKMGHLDALQIGSMQLFLPKQ